MKQVFFLFPAGPISASEVPWIILGADGVVGEGKGVTTPPLDADSYVAIVPGMEVAVHWLKMPARLNQVQAQAAARLQAHDFSAQPVDRLHIVVGHDAGDGRRPVAIVDRAKMDLWLSWFANTGIVLDWMVPSFFLLAPPDMDAPDHVVHVFDDGDMAIVRGKYRAFAAPPAIAATMLGDAERRDIDRQTFEAGLLSAVRHTPLGLLQGDYAQKRRFTMPDIPWRKASVACLVFLAVLAAGPLGHWAHQELSLRAAQASLIREARAVLPAGVAVTAPLVQVEAYYNEERYGRLASAIAPIFQILESVPDAELRSLLYLGKDQQVRFHATAPARQTLFDLKTRLDNAHMRTTMEAPVEGSALWRANFVVEKAHD